MNRPLQVFLCLAVLQLAGCARDMPRVDLGKVESGLLSKCQARGALILEDERYEDYWARNYDTYKVGRLRKAGTTASVTVADPIRRRVLRILSREGADQLSELEVIHFREQTPPIEVRIWTAEGTPRAVNVNAVGSRSMAEWPCETRYPRATTFKIGPLNPGDTVEIIHALSGPQMETWRFADERFCTLSSKATFGHKHDSASTHLPMDAVIFDTAGVVKRVSKDGASLKVYELTKAAEPMPPADIPLLVRSRRCRDWPYLQGKVFHMPIWMARDGSLPTSEGGVPKELLEEVPEGKKAERIRAVAKWISGIPVEERPVSFWMRWLPQETGQSVAARNKGSKGGIAALALRILEEAGLKPRYAVLHTDDTYPFAETFASPLQFDTLAIVVADDTGQDHFIVPGQPSSDAPVPPAIKGRKALVMKRWLADRITGGGSCSPQYDMLWSCYNPSKALEAMELITVK
jgi:hypothetical protein